MQFFLRARARGSARFFLFVNYLPLDVHLLHFIAQPFVTELVIWNILIINKNRDATTRVSHRG